MGLWRFQVIHAYCLKANCLSGKPSKKSLDYDSNFSPRCIGRCYAMVIGRSRILTFMLMQGQFACEGGYTDDQSVSLILDQLNGRIK